MAPLLADRLGMAWVDCDAELEQREGRSIPEIMARGEAEFRRREAELLVDLLEHRETVLATGGGAVLNPSVRDRCRTRWTVWLHATPDVLARRIHGSDRPALTGLDPLAELEHLLAEREPWYREASTLRIDVGREPPEAVAARIAAAWERTKPREG